MPDSNPYARLRAWFESTGWTQSELARRIDCHHSYVRLLLREEKLPGRLIANAIERESRAWEHGPIRSEEWDEVERQRRGRAEEADPAPTGTEG